MAVAGFQKGESARARVRVRVSVCVPVGTELVVGYVRLHGRDGALPQEIEIDIEVDSPVVGVPARVVLVREKLITRGSGTAAFLEQAGRLRIYSYGVVRRWDAGPVLYGTRMRSRMLHMRGNRGLCFLAW